MSIKSRVGEQVMPQLRQAAVCYGCLPEWLGLSSLASFIGRGSSHGGSVRACS